MGLKLRRPVIASVSSLSQSCYAASGLNRTNQSNAAHNLGVILLAAGSSRRMGQPKLILPWGQTTVLGHQIGTWRKLSVRQIVVVYAANNEPILAELERLKFSKQDRILNPHSEEGMFSSIRCAAQWADWRPELTHWAITLGDQPHLRVETLQRLLAFSVGNPAKVCQPSRAGHLRHPVILPKQIFLRLKDPSASTLKDFLLALPVKIAGCEVDDPGLDLDIDEPGDYERVLALWSRTAA